MAPGEGGIASVLRPDELRAGRLGGSGVAGADLPGGDVAGACARGRGPDPGRRGTAGVRMADDNFGFNPLLGSARQKAALRLLANRGDLPRLVAWYGR